MITLDPRARGWHFLGGHWTALVRAASKGSHWGGAQWSDRAGTASAPWGQKCWVGTDKPCT